MEGNDGVYGCVCMDVCVRVLMCVCGYVCGCEKGEMAERSIVSATRSAGKEDVERPEKSTNVTGKQNGGTQG